MKRLIALALLAIGLPTAAAAQNDSTLAVYRVELILVEHSGASDARAADEPLDFRANPDPLSARAQAEAARRMREGLPRLPGSLVAEPETDDPPRHWLENADESIAPAPLLWTAPDAPSSAMAAAWQRLQRAADFSPLAWTGWYQTAPRGRAGRAQRVHDQVVVQRLSSIEPGRALLHPNLSFVPELWLPGMPAVLDSLFGPRSPDSVIYRIDGEAGFRQRQFLHLDLNLVWQEPTAAPFSDAPAPTMGLPDATDAQIAAAGDRAQEPAWQLHRLRDSRSVRHGRYEYFDGSRFGVLAYITRFEQKFAAPKPEPAAAPEAAAAAAPDPGPDTPAGAQQYH
ncbi:MAG: CsiV family protein [Wenzhouxiangellaceae bacterium]|nr:CsiV family protein [Wenzhouxiangellaceae bacterium]